MSNVDQPQRGWRLRGFWGVAVSLMVLAGLLVPILAESSANATSLRSSSVIAATTCPTDYSGSTVAQCGTTTTTRPGIIIIIILQISYSNGIVTWQACGYPSAAIGSPVQLYLAGHLQGQLGGRALVQAGGCAHGAFAICLVPALYPAVAVNQFGVGTSTMRVDRSGCPFPITLSGSSPLPGSGANGGGVLPFTGANILLLLLTAAVLIVLGYGIVRLNRQRQRAR
jgi:hypothetical protein